MKNKLIYVTLKDRAKANGDPGADIQNRPLYRLKITHENSPLYDPA